MHETCLIIIHDPGMTPGLESNQGPLAQQMSALPLNSPPINLFSMHSWMMLIKTVIMYTYIYMYIICIYICVYVYICV